MHYNLRELNELTEHKKLDCYSHLKFNEELQSKMNKLDDLNGNPVRGRCSRCKVYSNNLFAGYCEKCWDEE